MTLDHDVAAEVEQLRRQDDVGVSEAVNRPVRRGLVARAANARRSDSRQRVLGSSVDVTNVAEALEQLDGPRAR